MSFDDRRQRNRIQVPPCRVQLARNINLKPRLFINKLVYPKQTLFAGRWVIVVHIAEAYMSVDAEAKWGWRCKTAEDAVAVNWLATPRPGFLVDYVVVNDELQQALADAFRPLPDECRVANKATLLYHKHANAITICTDFQEHLGTDESCMNTTEHCSKVTLQFTSYSSY